MKSSFVTFLANFHAHLLRPVGVWSDGKNSAWKGTMAFSTTREIICKKGLFTEILEDKDIEAETI
jgi:hypothetical protein